MGLFFFFENNNLNYFMYFTALSAVLMLGPEFFVPRWSPSAGVPIVNAPCGRIVGTKMESRDGREIFAYRGIPYAKPPVGSLRFAQPEPLDQPFTEDFQGTKNAKHCPSPFAIAGYSTYMGSEDCLKLNVYFPNIELKVE